MAFLSEIHYQNSLANSSGNPEFIEVTLSAAEAANAGDYMIVTYQTDGSVHESYSLTDPAVTLTIDPVTGYYVYTVDVETTDPDHTGGSNTAEAIAFVNTGPVPNDVISFVDIGGGTSNITAIGGAADGATSTNIPASPAGETIQWDIFGNRVDGADTEGSSVTCFVADTVISTPNGEARVQDLKTGDSVLTADHDVQIIRWIGQSHISVDRLQAQPNLRPVRILAGTLGNNRPAADLQVSQQHRMLLTDPLFELYYGAKDFLVKAKDIAQSYENATIVSGDQPVEYFHLLFDKHEIIIANGSPSESFYPGKEALKALDAEQQKELFSLFPEMEFAGQGCLTQSIGTLKSWEMSVSHKA